MSDEQIQKPAEIAFGEFRLDLRNGLLHRGAEEVPLPPRALAVLVYLVERSDQVIGKQELMAAIWKDVVVEEASLKEAVSLLRQALGDDAQEPRYIQTVHRRGYRFVGLPPPESAAIQPWRPRGWKLGAAMIVGIVLGVLLSVLMPRGLHFVSIKGGDAQTRALAARLAEGAESSPGVTRFTVDAPPGYELAVSPVYGDTTPMVAFAADGSIFAFVARQAGRDQLYVRAMGEPEPRAVTGSAGARAPFFSPDGRWVGFFADGEIKIAAVSGGVPAVLCKVVDVDGASWQPDGHIVFGSPAGLSIVSVEGGEPQPLTRVDHARSERAHVWPQVLPDGSVVFTIYNLSNPRPQIALARRNRPGYEVLYDASQPQYLDDGHLLVMREGNILSLPFDLASGKVTGTPVTLRNDVLTDMFSWISHYAVARDGAMVLVHGPVLDPTGTLVWTDMAGAATPSAAPPLPYTNLALSPDGLTVAASLDHPDSHDIWTVRLTDGAVHRLTEGNGHANHPIWSADGKWVTYLSSDHPYSLTTTRLDGSETHEIPLARENNYLSYPGSYSPDGKELAITSRKPSGADVDVVHLADKQPETRYAHAGLIERYPHFSPDGRWIAYVSDAAGPSPADFKVYVRPRPGEGAFPVYQEAHQQTTQPDLDGYEDPFWSPDGHHLYYQDGDDVVRIDLSFASGKVTGAAHKLFKVRDLWLRGVSPDGKRLLFLKRVVLEKIPTQVAVELPAVRV